MGTRTTGECVMMFGDHKHSPLFQPYYNSKAGKCDCPEESKARDLCRHKSQRAKLPGKAKRRHKQAQTQVRMSSDMLPKLAHRF